MNNIASKVALMNEKLTVQVNEVFIMDYNKKHKIRNTISSTNNN